MVRIGRLEKIGGRSIRGDLMKDLFVLPFNIPIEGLYSIRSFLEWALF